MELEREIGVWYSGRVKWISNLTSRSTCSDVIQAILSSSSDCSLSDRSEDYILYECWRGVERQLKPRCRLLKLWNSWAGESENVILTLRSSHQRSIPTHFLIRQQENKLNKLRRQIKRTDRQIQKLHLINKSPVENENENPQFLLDIYRSIIDLNNQIDLKEKFILRLTSDIKQENHQEDFITLLSDVNQTLTFSRQLTEQSDQLEQQINETNQDIERKLILLDELELDWALIENIDMDSLDDDREEDEQISFNNTKHISPSPPPPILPIKSLTIQSRPTAIVEPSPSTFINRNKSKRCLSTNNLHAEELLLFKNAINTIPFPIHNNNYPFESFTNDQSDIGISYFHSNDEQLVTLV